MIRYARDKVRVMLIEDNRKVVHAIKSRLSPHHLPQFQIIAATSVVQALEILSKQTPDIILLDCNLSDDDITESFIEICHASPESIPLIVVANSAEHALFHKIAITETDELVTNDQLNDPKLSSRIINIIERHRLREEIRRGAYQYRYHANHSPVMMWESDKAGNFIFFNKAWLSFRGKKLEQETGKQWHNDVHKDDYGRYIDVFRKALMKRQCFKIEYRVKSYSGIYRWVLDVGTPRYDDDQHYQGLVGFTTDITDKVEAIKQAESREKRFRSLVSNIPGAVYSVRFHKESSEAQLDFISDEIETITKYSKQHFQAKGIAAFRDLILDEDYAAREGAIIQSIKNCDSYCIDFRIHRKNGDLRWIREQGRVVCDPSNSNYCTLDGVLFDITDRTKIEARANFLAYHDILTGLPNRMLFLDRVNQGMISANRSKEMLSILFVDLDHFKRINDTLGHVVGDKMIQMAAGRLSHVLYETDTVTRVGGDEYTILASHIKKPSDALKIGDKILAAFKTPFFIDGHELFMTCSIGISIYPNDGYDVDTLLKHADAAMYRAKDRGRNSYELFSPTMTTKAVARLKMENHLRHAIERGELKLHYQPQMNVKTGKIMGMEALIRWHHPELGIIPPSEFIPLAEEDGQIMRIGEWVLETACKQMHEWKMLGFSPVRMAINLSTRQLRQNDLVPSIVSIVRKYDIDPGQIEFELTEGVISQNEDACASHLGDLRDKGFRLAIDDFGIGYSSLSRLKKYPINTVKIDRDFVSEIPHNTDDVAIAETIILMSQSLNLDLIAEGVETIDQKNFLLSRGCHLMQGHLFCKASPPDNLKNLLPDKAE